MASTVTSNAAAQAEARVRDTHFTHGEVVALARLILRDSHLNVVAGSEWAYIARGHTLTYPSRVLRHVGRYQRGWRYLPADGRGATYRRDGRAGAAELFTHRSFGFRCRDAVCAYGE